MKMERRREFDTRTGQRTPRQRVRELVSAYDGQVMKLCCCDYPLLEPRIRIGAWGHPLFCCRCQRWWH